MLRTLVLSLAVAVSAALPAAAGAPQLPPQPKLHPAGVPNNALLVSPCIQNMGEHWAALKDLPTGPIYGVYKGKPVFSEIMVTVEQLQKGFSYENIRALPGYHIDHVNVNYEPKGHEGLPVPHYDVHAYYISAEEQSKICPAGIPDPSMRPMR